MDQRVVLCVIRPQDELPARLSHTDLFRFFSQFGSVKDVEIFNRKVLIKAFVEFGKQAEAENAIRVSHDQMTTFGKMQTFFSNKNSIIKRTKASSLNIASLGNLADTQRSPKGNKLAFLSTLPSQSFPPKPIEKGADARQLPSFGIFAPPGNKVPIDSTGNEFLLGDSCFNFDSNAGICSGPLLLPDPEHQPLADCKKMRVLMVNRINTKVVTVNHLFNLFGCYGNVNKVLINKENNYGLVQFQTGAQAVNACEKLKNLDFFGQTLKVKVSRYSSLNFKTLEKEHNDKLSHLHGPSTLFRFLNNSAESADAPTPVVKISNVPLALGPVLIHQWLEQCQEPERVVVLKDAAQETHTVYAEFVSVRQAVEVLCCLHGQQINEKIVEISFSSSKEAFES
jgi:RNA recognition motif-containing protein